MSSILCQLLNKQLARNRYSRFRANCVVCARWCPTLPHPGGCSTIGAVRLSFRVRDGAGRFPVAVTTETTGWAVRYRRLVRLFGYPSGRPCNPHSRTSTLGACVWLVVGLGVDRIVDASLLLSPPPGVGVLLFVLAY